MHTIELTDEELVVAMAALNAAAQAHNAEKLRYSGIKNHAARVQRLRHEASEITCHSVFHKLADCYMGWVATQP